MCLCCLLSCPQEQEQERVAAPGMSEEDSAGLTDNVRLMKEITNNVGFGLGCNGAWWVEFRGPATLLVYTCVAPVQLVFQKCCFLAIFENVSVSVGLTCKI